MTTTATTQEINDKNERGLEGAPSGRSGRIYAPAVDIVENQSRIIVLADMPGVDEHSVDISLEKNMLTICGRVDQNVPDGYQPAILEHDRGDYRRTFTIGEEIDRDGIEASVKNGVLRLILPKSVQAKTRKIAVSAA